MNCGNNLMRNVLLSHGFFYPTLSNTVCNVFGICLATFEHDGVLILSWKTPVHWEIPSVILHASQEVQFCVDNGSLNFMPTDVWLSDRLCTHVALYALSLSLCTSLLFPDFGSYQWPNGCASSERYVPEGLPRGMGARRRRTTASASLQIVKDDGWSTTRELPAPRGCTSLPKSSWQPFGDTKFANKDLEADKKHKKVQYFRNPWGGTTAS